MHFFYFSDRAPAGVEEQYEALDNIIGGNLLDALPPPPPPVLPSPGPLFPSPQPIGPTPVIFSAPAPPPLLFPPIDLALPPPPLFPPPEAIVPLQESYFVPIPHVPALPPPEPIGQIPEHFFAPSPPNPMPMFPVKLPSPAQLPLREQPPPAKPAPGKPV